MDDDFGRTATPRSTLLRRGVTTVLMLLFCWPSLATASCEKSLRWDDDPPFSMSMPDGEVAGIDVELNRAVLARLGCDVTLRKLPWGRALKDLELGRLDILPGAFRRPERELYAYFSGEILPPSRNILFIRIQALEVWPVSRLTELQHTSFRLGAQINVFYGADFLQVMSDPEFAARVTMVANRTSLWHMLDRGRIDGLIANEHTGAYEVRQLGLHERIKATNVVVSSEAAEVAFSKNSTDRDFVKAYAAVLEQLVADGSYGRIVQRYVTP